MQYDKVEERLLMFPNSTLELSHLVIVDNKKKKGRQGLSVHTKYGFSNAPQLTLKVETSDYLVIRGGEGDFSNVTFS
jgi:hypothetical protein